MTLGQRLARHRKQKGMTQQQLGEQLSISAQAVSKWENDQAEPDVSSLIRLSEILEVSLEELLKGKKEAAPAAEVPTKPAAEIPVTAEEVPQSKPAPTFFKKAKATLVAHKWLFISLVCLLLAIATLLVVAPLTFLQPCSKFSYNRVEEGMTIEEVEKMLGAPHKKTVIKSLGDEIYEDDGSLGSSFAEGFLEGLYGESSTVLSTTYFYYDGAYGRALGKIAKLEEKMNNAETFAEIERFEEEIIEIEEKLKDMTYTSILKITFGKNGKVEQVLYKNSETNLKK